MAASARTLGWALVLVLAGQVHGGDSITVVPRPDTPPSKSAPGPSLATTTFSKLPVGAVRPEGWLRRQLA